MDIEGNTFDVGDIVYATACYGNSKKLLRCEVMLVSKSRKTCRLKITSEFGGTIYSKRCNKVVVPKLQEDL